MSKRTEKGKIISHLDTVQNLWKTLGKEKKEWNIVVMVVKSAPRHAVFKND